MRGGSETVKVYDRLKLAGYAENDINDDFNFGHQGRDRGEKHKERVLCQKFSEKRIPIKRRAHGVTFKVSGYGDVVLREVELDSRVVGRV